MAPTTRLRPPGRAAAGSIALGTLLACAAATLGTAPRVGADPFVNDPSYPLQHADPQVHAEEGWRKGAGQGQIIAIVDTGIDLTHEEFVGNLPNGKPKLVPGKSFVPGVATPQDDQGHGTHCAGISAGTANNGKGIAGIAPLAQLMPVKVLSKDGSGQPAWVNDGIRWAADNGATVINLSLGSDFVGTLANTDFSTAVNYAFGKGVVVAIAAGNSGGSGIGNGYTTQNGMVVAAVNRFDQKTSYSEPVGTAKWPISAPGGDGGTSGNNLIYSTDFTGTPNAYGYKAGTSMATPVVAGAAAVLRSLGLDAQQTIDKLLNTAVNTMDGYDAKYLGKGRVDVGRAVAGLSGPPGLTLGDGKVTAKTATTQHSFVTTPGDTSKTGASSGGGGPALPGSSKGGTTVPPSSAGSATTATTIKGFALPPTKKKTTGTGDVTITGVSASSSRPWVPGGVAAALLVGTGAAAASVNAGARRRRRAPGR